MAKFGIGQPVRRVEDPRLVTGAGRYSDDINLPNQVHGFVLRSPHAHARIRGIDTSAAKAAPGVLAVLTGAELGSAGIPCMIPLKNRDGSSRADPLHPILCKDEVNYVGDNVAFVVAESRAQAQDAAELIEVDYDVLPAVADTAKAMDAGPAAGPPRGAAQPRLRLALRRRGRRTDAAFAKAAHVTKLELVNNRVVCNAMEPRACVAE